jgi:hypothetical protein
MLDTNPRATAQYLELLRAMDPARRLEIAGGLSRAVRDLALAGLRNRHPAATEEEIRGRLTLLLYGRSASLRVHGSAPEDLG